MSVKGVAAGTFVPSNGSVVTNGQAVIVKAGTPTANGTLVVSGGSVTQVTVATNAALMIDQQASVNINQYDSSGSFAATVAVAANAATFTLANATTRIVVDALSVQVKLQSGTGLSASGRINIAGGVLTGVSLPTFYSLVNNGLAIVVPVTGTYVDRITPQVNSAGAITGFTLS